MKPVFIQAYDLNELWFRALWEMWNQHQGESSRDYLVERGSFEGGHKRRELDYFTGHVLNPAARPLHPIMPEGSGLCPPTDEAQINRYFEEYIVNSKVAPNQEYTYGERINKSVDLVLDMLQATPNTNQAIIQIGEPLDIYSDDPPCLRHIDCRIKDGKLHFIIYFRSWDLYAGMPENLGGLQLLKEYMGIELGVEDGEMIVSSKGLHVYDYAWGEVEQLIKYTPKEK